MKEAAKKYVDVDYKPDVLIADSSPEITEGFTRVFGKPRKRINCWAHAIRNIDDHLKTVKDKKVRADIRADIFKLQTNPHPEAMQAAFDLFEAKWTKQNDPAINGFLDYFT